MAMSLPQVCTDAGDQTIEGVVISERIVMGQRDPLHLRAAAELHYVFDRAMSPADLGRILFGSVLRVVDEKVGAVNKFGVRRFAQ